MHICPILHSSACFAYCFKFYVKLKCSNFSRRELSEEDREHEYVSLTALKNDLTSQNLQGIYVHSNEALTPFLYSIYPIDPLMHTAKGREVVTNNRQVRWALFCNLILQLAVVFPTVYTAVPSRDRAVTETTLVFQSLFCNRRPKTRSVANRIAKQLLFCSRKKPLLPCAH
jgi:hypothetical protein